jgi:hypothetical protein
MVPYSDRLKRYVESSVGIGRLTADVMRSHCPRRRRDTGRGIVYMMRLSTMRMSMLLSYARMVRSIDLEVGPGDPEWLSELRRKLLRRMENYEAYLELRHVHKPEEISYRRNLE